MLNQKQILSKLIISGLLVFSLVIPLSTAHAIDCSGSLDNPTIDQLMCPIIRVVNILAYAVGAIFIIVLIWGAFKLAMAQGDPKAYASAINTWYWLVVGAFVVVGYFAFTTVLSKAFGFQMVNPLDTFQANIRNFLCNAKLGC